MTRWAAAAFFVVCGLMFTGVLEPLTQGRDDSWAILLTPVAATFGLALAVRAWRMLFAPLALAFAGVVAFGDDPLAMAGIAVVGFPALAVVAATGVLAGRRRERNLAWVVTASFVVAAVPVLWGTVETVRRATASELPREVQAQLPLDDSLAQICDGASRLRTKGEALVRELRAHPRSLVVFTYEWAHEPPARERITVREVAQEQLSDLERTRCAPKLQRRLRSAL